jgi:acyl-CoA synthetase (AMP-forming)/AMP-acid ligase II
MHLLDTKTAPWNPLYAWCCTSRRIEFVCNCIDRCFIFNPKPTVSLLHNWSLVKKKTPFSMMATISMASQSKKHPFDDNDDQQGPSSTSPPPPKRQKVGDDSTMVMAMTTGTTMLTPTPMTTMAVAMMATTMMVTATTMSQSRSQHQSPGTMNCCP